MGLWAHIIIYKSSKSSRKTWVPYIRGVSLAPMLTPLFVVRKSKKKASSVVKTITLAKNHAEDNVFSYDFEVENFFKSL